MAKLDIIIPVYNEDENIVTLLKLLDSEVICNFRVLICYDDESDKTLKHLKNLNIIKNEIILIKNPKQGPNSAIIEGINSSKAKIILVFTLKIISKYLSKMSLLFIFFIINLIKKIKGEKIINIRKKTEYLKRLNNIIKLNIFPDDNFDTFF